MYSAKEIDEAKTKIMKYIVYKRRTENEIRKKFDGIIEEDLLEEIIDYLKEAGYINDKDYIRRAINNFQLLKNMSNMELKYKLIAKGINKNLIEDYFYDNKEELIEYEINSAKNIIAKKRKDLEEIEIKSYLMKKGYKQDSIKEAFEEE